MRTPLFARRHSQGRLRSAFTLIELLVVVGIIATLASIVITAVNPRNALSSAHIAANKIRSQRLLRGIQDAQRSGLSFPNVPSGIGNAKDICISSVTGADCTTGLDGYDLSSLISDYVTEIDAASGSPESLFAGVCIYQQGQLIMTCVAGVGDCGCSGFGSVAVGPFDPDTAGGDDSAGSVAWTLPEQAKTQNDTNSFVTLDAGNAAMHSSEYLLVQDFGFTIPSGNTITGIEVEVDKHSVLIGVGILDAAVRMIGADGTILSSDKSNEVLWPTSDTDAYVSYGGEQDTWGRAWTNTEINDVDFGVALRAQVDCDTPGTCGATSPVARVDHVRVTVYYSPHSCFLPGTRITMADGTQRNIEDLRIGDRVIGWDDERNEPTVNIVQALLARRNEEGHYSIWTDVGELRVTGTHPFMTNPGTYVAAQDLEIGQTVQYFDDGDLTEVRVLSKQLIPGSPLVYNLETDGTHNYVAGGVVVHNKSILSSSSSVSSGY